MDGTVADGSQTAGTGGSDVRPTSPRRGRAREEAILAAVVELVGEVGYERVTVNAIAERARASKATMYAKWPGKAELVAYALRRQAQGGDPVVVADTGSLRGDLLAVVGGIARAISGAGGKLSLLTLVGALRDDPGLRDQVRTQIQVTSAQNVHAICARAVDRGELTPDGDAGAVLDLAFSHLFLTTLLQGDPPDHAQQAWLVDDVVLPLLHLARRRGDPAAATQAG